jgi:hypothetical protein
LFLVLPLIHHFQIIDDGRDLKILLGVLIEKEAASGNDGWEKSFLNHKYYYDRTSDEVLQAYSFLENIYSEFRLNSLIS